MLKRFLNLPAVQNALGVMLGWYMLLVGWANRWEHIGLEHVEPLWAQGGPVVACFSHGRVVLSHFGWGVRPGGGPHQPAKVMISHSREGAIAAAATRTVGADVIRGSSAKRGQAKGGIEALRECLRHLSANGVVAIAPDGPRGPRMRAGMGPVQLAKHAGAPIIAFAWSTSRRRVFSSWDRFVLPFPFGRGVYVWSQPITVPRHADAAEMERARLDLEAALIRVTNEADRRAGGVIVEPAAQKAVPEPA